MRRQSRTSNGSRGNGGNEVTAASAERGSAAMAVSAAAAAAAVLDGTAIPGDGNAWRCPRRTGSSGENGEAVVGGVAGFGAGDGVPGSGATGGAGGGGLGAGADIFVAQGGALTNDGGCFLAAMLQARRGSPNAMPGAAFGSGIFLQGSQSVTLEAPAGHTLTINDVIADQNGSGDRHQGGTGSSTSRRWDS